MKYVKIIMKIPLKLILLILIILIIDYIRLNIFYIMNKENYIEIADTQGNKDKYAPQGLTYSKKYNVILQTSYNKNNISKLYIISFETGELLKELELIEIDDRENHNHVGGIATNDETVWITNDYEINEYNLEEIMTTENRFIKSIKNDKLPNRGDFCTYNNNTLWIGDFYLKPFYNVPDNKPLLLGYDIDNLDYNNPKYTIILPKMVQGMAITENNNFIFTRSYTNLINSKLTIYKDMTAENHVILKEISLPPMAEGIFYKDNEIYILFENNSDKYFFAYPKVKKIIKISV